MLTGIRIRNFKSFRREATMPLGPLTLLIGANASGKSNALEAVRLLKWIGEGQRLGNIRSHIQDSDSAIRGRVQDLFFDPEKPLGLGCDFQIGAWTRFDLGLALSPNDTELHVVSEAILKDAPPPLYEVKAAAEFPGTDIKVAYDNFSPGKKPQITCSDQMGVFTQLTTPARFGASHKKSQTGIPWVCREFNVILEKAVFLDPVPGLMHEYEPEGDTALDEAGSNLSSVAHSLLTGRLKRDWFDDIVDLDSVESIDDFGALGKNEHKNFLSFLSHFPEQNIVGIGFTETPRHEVMLNIEEQYGRTTRTFDAAVLSDGTLRVLAVAVALFSARPGALVIIEEIDNGIHPSRADGLMEKIHQIAVARNLRVVLSSHNPALMDALPDAALPDTVFVYRDPAEGDSRMVRLGDLHRYPELVSQGPLGHLVTRGVVDRMVKDPSSPEDRTEAALDWLRKLG